MFQEVSLLVTLSPDLLDPAAARAFWIRLLRPTGPDCASCGCVFDGVLAARWKDGERVTCACGVSQTWQRGTIFGKTSPLTDRQLFVIAYLVQQDLATSDIAAAVGVSPDTVLRWKQRFQELQHVG